VASAVADLGLRAELAAVRRFLPVLDPAGGEQQPTMFGEPSVTDPVSGLR
jgi:hypothetical protein